MLSNNHGVGQEPKALNKETRGFHAASVQHWGFGFSNQSILTAKTGK
jgi:hypothetical protein